LGAGPVFSFRPLARGVISCAMALAPLAAQKPPAPAAAPPRLTLQRPLSGELAGGQVRTYVVQLVSRQYAHVTLLQPGFAVIVRVQAAAGKGPLVELHLPGGAQKNEPLCWIGASPGQYRIQLTADRLAGHSSYRITLDDLRAPLPSDDERVEAQLELEKARALGADGKAEEQMVELERALGRYANLGDRDGSIRTLLVLGLAARNASQLDKAQDAFQKARDAAREVRDGHAEDVALNGLGIVLEFQGQYEKSVPVFQEAVKVRHDLRDLEGESASLSNLADAYLNLDRWQDSKNAYERVIALALQTGNRGRQSDGLTGLANFYANRNQFAQAIGYLRLALALLRSTKDRRGEAETLTSLAIVSGSQGRNREAMAYFERALVIYRDSNDRRGVGTILSNLAVMHASLAEYEQALDSDTKALAAFRAGSVKKGEETVLNNLGSLYATLNQPAKAIDCYEQAVKILGDIQDPEAEGIALANLGEAHARMNQYETAIEYYERALAIARKQEEQRDEAQTLSNLGAAYARLGQGTKAIESYEQSVSLCRKTKDRQGEARALVGLGAAYSDSKQDEKAIGCHRQALGIAREIEDRAVESAAFEGLMLAWKDRHPNLAIFCGKQSINALQAIRAGNTGLSQDLRRSFLSGNEAAYRELADLLVSRGRLAEAEQVLNLLKDEEYYEFLRRDANQTPASSRRASLTAEESAWAGEDRAIRERLVALGAEFGRLQAKASLTPREADRFETLQRDLSAGNAAFERFLKDLTEREGSDAPTQERLAQVAQARGIMDALNEMPKGVVAIYTMVGAKKFRAILITRDVRKAYEYPIGAVDLNRKILQFRELVRDPRLDPRPMAQDLYRILIGGMEEDLRQAGAETLMWSLDGCLRYLPIPVLFDGASYLVEKYKTAVFTPASDTRLKDRPDRTWRAAGFGVTESHDDAPALPEVAQELDGIIRRKAGNGVLEGVVRLDGQFTEREMLLVLRGRYPVVHVASHFHFEPGSPDQSFLLLGDGTHLSMAKLRNMPNLFTGVQLLTLSACDTGSGDGKEVEGFGALAQLHGAKAVIASLWPVADDSTSLLMQEFYRFRESRPGISKAESLQSAQLELLRGGSANRKSSQGRKPPIPESDLSGTAPRFPYDPENPYAHPFFWAPFFIMGNWL
jgi:CHAT domain-containing protein/Tfp pilus assembly protein PilF